MTPKNIVTNALLAAGFVIYVAGLATKIYFDPLIFTDAAYKTSLTETQRADYRRYADYGTAANIASFLPLGIIAWRKIRE